MAFECGGAAMPLAQTKAMYRSSDESDDRRREFYDTILSRPQTRPEFDFKRLTDAWRRATNATWTWLWLKNPYLSEKPWELRELSCDDDLRGGFVPEHPLAPSPRPVAAYCAATGEPEYVTDLETWTRTLDDEIYSVACAGSLREMGCKSFLTVPFRAPTLPGETLAGAIRDPLRIPLQGVVCSHYRDQADYVAHPPESLKLMGRLTALTISNSFKTAQQEILLELNALAHDYLTRMSRQASDDRKECVSSVIALLQKHLSVKAVSVFYEEDEFIREIHCLGTTGLTDAAGEPVPDDRCESIRYRPGEGLTGGVYSTGEPLVLSQDDGRDHTPRYVDTVGTFYVPRRRDAVLYPIPRPRGPAESSREQPRARGVIRCAGHVTPLFESVSRPFDPVDMETLAFIARQIAPLLETLTVRIRREQTISIIKHDLFSPLGMIRDTTEDLAKNAEEGGFVRAKYYDVMDLGASAIFASNLVHQLDPQPERDRKPEFMRTLLERSIIARIKNMLSHFALRENEMRIHFDGFREIPPLWIDRDLMERVFVNLLTNAVKYGERGTAVVVQARALSQSYRIDVSNQGVGVPDDERQRIFERGYRSREVVGKKLGIGLGLYIARIAVEQHGGRLLLTSIKDPTTFSVFLPESLKRGPFGNG